jgi:hypothetical protein
MNMKVTTLTKIGMEKKQERANSCHHTRALSSGKLVKTYAKRDVKKPVDAERLG